MADSVQLTDLDVITSYSIAVRTATADRDELIATLRADLEWLESGVSEAGTDDLEDEPAPAAARRAPVSHDDFFEPVEPEIVVTPPAQSASDRPRAPLRRMPATITPTRQSAAVKKAAPKKPVAKNLAAKKTVAKKTVAKKAPSRRR